MGSKFTKAKVERLSRSNDGTYAVLTSACELQSRAVIVATGTRAKRIDIEGLRDIEDHRVLYDPMELPVGAVLREHIIVYGGGDAAFDMGLYLRHRGNDVTILCRSRARCLPLLRKRADKNGVQVVEGRSI